MKIVCVNYLLAMLNVAWIKFLSYGDDIISSCNLRNFVTDKFLNNDIKNGIIMLAVKFFLFTYVATDWCNKDEYTVLLVVGRCCVRGGSYRHAGFVKLFQQWPGGYRPGFSRHHLAIKAVASRAHVVRYAL